MIVKSRFSISGNRGTANLGYISREGALEGGRAPVHDREGNIIHKEDFKELRQEIRKSEMERRLIFSPENPMTSAEDIGLLVRDAIERFQTETERDFDYVYAIHDHNDRTHAHVLAWGDREDLRMDRDDLSSLREQALSLELESEKAAELEHSHEVLLEQDNAPELDIQEES
jgi:hypothetical protein